jgi:uncharacterized membrane protein
VLNSILVHASAVLFGPSPWAVRLPAIAFGIAGVWAFWFVACAIWPRRPALAGTVLFAASYYHVFYSQNARGYSALMFFALTATGFVIRLAEDDPRRRAYFAVGYSIATALGLYAMLLMAFVVAGHALVLIATRRWRVLLVLASGVGLAALLYTPMAASLVEYYRTRPVETGYPLLSRAFAQSIAPVAAVLVVGGLLALPLLLRLIQRNRAAAAFLLTPIAFNIVVPIVRGQGVYPRSFVYALPIAYLLLVEAIDWLLSMKPAIAWTLAGAVAIVSAIQLAPYYRLPKQGFRQAIAYIDQHRAPGDARVGFTLGGKAAQFYDPSFLLVEDEAGLRAWMEGAQTPAWIVSTFPREMRTNEPALYRWLEMNASPRAEFPGVIGDGTVHVHYWRGK